MESFPYEDFSDPQYPDGSPYYAPVPSASPYQQYPGQAPYTTAQFGDPRQWSQTPGRQAAHPTHFQVPNMPVGAYAATSMVPQWQPMRSEADADRSRERIRRTRTACEECRKRKQRCDGNHPCQQCTEQRTDCQYRDIQPSKKDSQMDRMLRLAETNHRDLESMNSSLDSMNITLGRIDRRLGSQDSRRASFQAGTQSGYPPATPQYRGAPSSSRSNTWSEREDSSSGNRSKRRRH